MMRVLYVVLACFACAKSPEPTASAPTEAPKVAAPVTPAAPAKSQLIVELEAMEKEIAGLDAERDTLQTNVVKTESMVTEADDQAKRAAATAWIDEQSKLRAATLAKLPSARTKVAALDKAARGADTKPPGPSEAEVNQATAAANKAHAHLDRIDVELQEIAKRTDAAKATLQRKQDDADRAAATQKLEQLKREQAEGRKK